MQNTSQAVMVCLNLSREDNSDKSVIKNTVHFRKIAKKKATGHKFVIILSEKVRTLNYNIMLLLLAGYLFFSLMFQAYMGYSKYQTLSAISSDTEQRIICADLNARELKSLSDVLFIMDMARQVVEGVLPDNLYAEVGYPSIIGRVQDLKKSNNMHMNMFFWQVEIRMANLSFPSLLDKGLYGLSKRTNLLVYNDTIHQYTGNLVKSSAAYKR